MATTTEAQWRATGEQRFGADQENWRIKCPNCGNELSARLVREKYPREIKAGKLKGFRLEQECIGRYIDDIDCDWCAYGLFSGPDFVERDNGKKTPVFPFAEAL